MGAKERIMTMQGEEQQVTDELDQDQQSLDKEQETGSNDQPVTNEQLQQFMEQQNRTYTNLEAQVRGLHSGFNKALDGIRAEASSRQAAQAQQATAQQLEQEIANAPEEMQPALRLLQQQNHQQQQVEQLRMQQEAQPPQDTSVHDAQVQALQEAQGVARDIGVDPQNPNIDYRALLDESITVQERRARFFSSLGKLVEQKVQNPVAPAKTQRANNEVNPPTESGPRSPASLKSADDYRDAYISGRISKEQFTEGLNALGERA